MDAAIVKRARRTIKNLSEKELERVRKRKSYAKWKKFLLFLNKKPNQRKLLERVHDSIDSYRGYRSERNSYYSLQSLEVLMDDNRKNKF